jgi:hypothetical protein
VAASVAKSVYLKACSLFIEQPCICGLRVVPAIERSKNVSTTVEMNRPTDKKKITVGKENKVQKDLFGILNHDELDAFR